MERRACLEGGRRRVEVRSGVERPGKVKLVVWGCLRLLLLATVDVEEVSPRAVERDARMDGEAVRPPPTLPAFVSAAAAGRVEAGVARNPPVRTALQGKPQPVAAKQRSSPSIPRSSLCPRFHLAPTTAPRPSATSSDRHLHPRSHHPEIAVAAQKHPPTSSPADRLSRWHQRPCAYDPRLHRPSPPPRSSPHRRTCGTASESPLHERRRADRGTRSPQSV